MYIKFEVAAWRNTKWYEYGFRFIFGGTVTVLAGLIAKRFGPGVGGLFLAFPAIFPASASLIEKHERERKNRIGMSGTKRGRMAAGVEAAGAAMGSVGLIGFAILTWYLLPRLSLWLTLMAATSLWGAAAAGCWFVNKRA